VREYEESDQGDGARSAARSKILERYLGGWCFSRGGAVTSGAIPGK
jgi:hypothetical protein